MSHGALAKQVPKLASALLILYGLVTPALCLSSAKNAREASVLCFLALWAVSPALGAFWLVRLSRRDTIAGSIVLVGILLIFGQAVCVYTESFYFYPKDAQNGMTAAFMPLIQWLGILVLYLVVGHPEEPIRQMGDR